MYSKPTSSEDEFFARENAEKIKRHNKKLQEEGVEAEKEMMKSLHWMKCPECGMNLSSVVFRGISIEKCSTCEGVFIHHEDVEKLTGEESSIIKSLSNLFK